MRVEVDRAACRGARACVRRAPATFRLDAERKAMATAPSDDDEAVILQAVQACPNFALAAWRGDERVA